MLLYFKTINYFFLTMILLSHSGICNVQSEQVGKKHNVKTSSMGTAEKTQREIEEEKELDEHLMSLKNDAKRAHITVEELKKRVLDTGKTPEHILAELGA